MSDTIESQRPRLKQVAEKAILKYGTTRQMNKLQEECGELIAAVNHVREKRPSAMDKLAEELADVFFMVEQGRQICDGIVPGLVEKKLSEKMERMEERLEK